MPKRPLALARTFLCALLLLTGCMPTAIPASRNYLLVRHEGTVLVVVPEQEALYERFDEIIQRSPEVSRLITLFEHTTVALLGGTYPTRYPQTVANQLIIVVDSEQTQLLQDVRLWDGARWVTVEWAVGIGEAGQLDGASASEQVVSIIPRVLLELVNYPAPSSPLAAATGEPTIPAETLAEGFAAALATSSPTAQQLEAYGDEQRYPVRPDTPAGVAHFLNRLLLSTNAHYPQRFMLWFAHFDSEETPYAKLMLALLRLTPAERRLGLPGLIDSYMRTFPAEREQVQALASETFRAGWR